MNFEKKMMHNKIPSKILNISSGLITIRLKWLGNFQPSFRISVKTIDEL